MSQDTAQQDHERGNQNISNYVFILILTCLGNLKYLLTLIDKGCAAGDHPLADFILYNKEHLYKQIVN